MNNKMNNIIIAVLVAVVVLMGVAFAAFSTTLNINGTASIASTWDITMTAGTCTGTGSGTVTMSGNVATISASIPAPGNVLNCTVNIVNNGSLDATATYSQPAATTHFTIVGTPGSPVTIAKKSGTATTQTLTFAITYKSTATDAPGSAETFQVPISVTQKLS